MASSVDPVAMGSASDGRLLAGAESTKRGFRFTAEERDRAGTVQASCWALLCMMLCGEVMKLY